MLIELSDDRPVRDKSLSCIGQFRKENQLPVHRRVVDPQASQHPLEGTAVIAVFIIRRDEKEVENIPVIHRPGKERHALIAPVNLRAPRERHRQPIPPGESRFMTHGNDSNLCAIDHK